ncbi:MAG TPA: TonB-dependent receptor plug domain-containing protein [Sphingomicrobium sp.]|nr:TonB-dependent receptor plug domain-containing protein [Sphingomicrobium sp.]
MAWRLLVTSGIAAFTVSPALAQTPGPAAAPQGTSTPAPASRTTAYDATFFAKYAPRTALDIVQRIPGFTLDLGANNNNNGNGPADIRGFAGVAGNVVINGERPSTKSEPLDAYLSRIPASRVKRVEVGPGDLYGADYASKSQVANLILIEGGPGGVSGNASVTAERHYTGRVTPTASGSVSLNRGPSTFNIAGDTAWVDLTEEGADVVTDPATGQLIEFRRKRNVTNNYSPFVSASWSLDEGPSDSANLNLRYHFDRFHLFQTAHVFPADASEHDDTVVENYPTKSFEIGGDVTRPLAGGALKFVGLASRQRRHTLDESDTGNLGHTEVVGGVQQLSQSQRNETLGRVTWSNPKLLGFQFESGAEVAWNTLDFNLNLFTFDQSGVKTRVDLPLDNARVTELRGEFWINGSRPLTKTLRMDLGLNYETSRLKVSGDATADRALSFPKPSITLDWRPGHGWDAELILRRTVAQLDFFDFISVADLGSNQVNGGNANLQPQRSWEGRFSVEHPLFGQGKARLELGYNLISLLQDRILTPDGFDAPGNIGTGRQTFADLTLDAPLDRFWKGLRVKLHGNVQQTRVEDPISGELRDFSGFFPTWEWDADVRRDRGRLSYGFTAGDNARTTIFNTNRLDTRWNGGVFVSAFAEYRPTPKQTLRLDLNDISNVGGGRNLLEFFPNRTAGQPSVLDHRFRNSHVRIALTFKQSFGGSGGVAKS